MGLGLGLGLGLTVTVTVTVTLTLALALTLTGVLVLVEQELAVTAALQPTRIGGGPARRVALAEQVTTVGAVAVPPSHAPLGEVVAVLASSLAEAPTVLACLTVAPTDLGLCSRVEDGRATPPFGARALEDARVARVLGKVGAAVPRLLG